MSGTDDLANSASIGSSTTISGAIIRNSAAASSRRIGRRAADDLRHLAGQFLHAMTLHDPFRAVRDLEAASLAPRYALIQSVVPGWSVERDRRIAVHRADAGAERRCRLLDDLACRICEIHRPSVPIVTITGPGPGNLAGLAGEARR